METRLLDFPVEIMAKVFMEMDVETAWSARGVCRYWRDIFELVSYGSTQSPLTGIKIGVDAVCGITSSTGEIMDQHVVHGDLTLTTKNTASKNKKMARWVYEKKKYEYWPGGKWRQHHISDVITDVKLHISGLPTQTPSVTLRVGHEIGIRGDIVRSEDRKDYSQAGNGKFQDFTLLIDTVEESSYNDNIAIKHCIKGFVAPKWQIYALLVHRAKTQRELLERLHLHYVQSYFNSYSHVMTKQRNPEPKPRTICSEASGWMYLPPRWNLGMIEC
jgi:hypothetical protein